MARALAAKGVPVLVSNHDTPWTRELYQSARIHTFSVRRSISCDGGNRSEAGELLAAFLPE